MKYGITSDEEDWTDRDIIVTIFGDGTACPRSKAGYLSHKRSTVQEAITNAETWLAKEAHNFDRILLHLLEDAELPDDLN